MIKLGLYASTANPPRGDNMDRCVAEAIAAAEMAEACGFHGFFFGEHHQDRDGFLPSPLIACSAVAARTKTMQIGTSVLLLPLQHPLRIAEDVVTLDAVSGGRVALGVGLGYQDADFRAMGIEKKHRVGRFEEAIEILRKAWTGEPFDHKGRYFDIENVRVTPKPIQKPRPPIWLVAWVPAALERAGRLGDAIVMDPSWPLHESAEVARQYREAAHAAGNEPVVVMMRDAWVADSLEDAARVYGPEVTDAYRYYWRNGHNAFQDFKSEDELNFENVWQDRIITGSPEMCIAEFKRWSEVMGSDYFLLRLRHAHSGGPPHKEIMSTIERFGKDVIPYLKS